MRHFQSFILSLKWKFFSLYQVSLKVLMFGESLKFLVTLFLKFRLNN